MNTLTINLKQVIKYKCNGYKQCIMQQNKSDVIMQKNFKCQQNFIRANFKLHRR